nr:hypothetical protein [uncultured Oscillibacter sp.]
MLFTVTGASSVCGIASMAGALAAPFLLYRLIAKAVEHRSAASECAVLAGAGLAFCLWLWTVFGTLAAG